MSNPKGTITKLAVALTTTCTLLSCAGVANNSQLKEDDMISNKEKAVALLTSIETGDKAAISYVNPQKYIQHNLGVADGLQGFGEALPMLPEGSAKVNVIRSFSDGDYVFTHTDYNFFGPKIRFDIFRFEDGLIVEHWDNLTETSTTPNPSGRTQIDGDTKVTDLAKTEENRDLVSNFISDVLINGQYDKLAQYISTEKYLQHNTSIADGLDGLGAGMKYLADQGIDMIYTKNHMILSEGNFVLAVSEGTFGGAPTSYYDLFRIESGKIVEHWDVIETIAPESEWKNSNGKF